MAYLFPILRDEIHTQYIFQYLESQDPILTYLQRVAPAGEQDFEISGARKSKSLKNRRQRASEAAQTTKSREISLLTSKSQHPAKITYSIPDFLRSISNIYGNT